MCVTLDLKVLRVGVASAFSEGNRHESVEIGIEISDTAFAGASEISIQDAAPMAFEK